MDGGETRWPVLIFSFFLFLFWHSPWRAERRRERAISIKDELTKGQSIIGSMQTGAAEPKLLLLLFLCSGVFLASSIRHEAHERVIVNGLEYSARFALFQTSARLGSISYCFLLSSWRFSTWIQIQNKRPNKYFFPVFLDTIMRPRTQCSTLKFPFDY